jgi:hypothetical protein
MSDSVPGARVLAVVAPVVGPRMLLVWASGSQLVWRRA